MRESTDRSLVMERASGRTLTDICLKVIVKDLRSKIGEHFQSVEVVPQELHERPLAS